MPAAPWPSTCGASPPAKLGGGRAPLPALLHHRPERIAGEVQAALARLRGWYDTLAVAYADCGTNGGLDGVLDGVPRLAAAHCYDVLAGAHAQAALDEEPGTYLLTDFLARTFEHTVVRELGLDRHPELRDAYFGNYRRVLWLASTRPPLLAPRRSAPASGWACRSRCARSATRRSRPNSRAYCPASEIAALLAEAVADGQAPPSRSIS